MDLQGVASSLKFYQSPYYGSQILSIKLLVFRLDGSVFLPVPHFRRHAVIVSLQFVYETVRLVANDRLAPIIHWHEIFKGILEVTSIMRLSVDEL